MTGEIVEKRVVYSSTGEKQVSVAESPDEIVVGNRFSDVLCGSQRENLPKGSRSVPGEVRMRGNSVEIHVVSASGVDL